jgi:23S rRNA (adenine2503-C2)-methyltransferase
MRRRPVRSALRQGFGGESWLSRDGRPVFARGVEILGRIDYVAAMQTVSAAPMPIPGHIDPVPVPRAPSLREDGRIDLIGLSKEQLRATLLDAGMELKQAK